MCILTKPPQLKATMADDAAAARRRGGVVFVLPVHYPRFTGAQYATMEEWRLNNLLAQYGLPSAGGLGEKRKDAMGHFLWPDQLLPEADARPRGCDGVKGNVAGGFKMPVHYPRFTGAQYAAMEEWRLDNLLKQYGLPLAGGLEEKRKDAVGHFLWPEQLRPMADARPCSDDGSKESIAGGFRMPVHYPRLAGAQYAAMEEWQLDNLLNQYGLPHEGGLEEKRKEAMAHFLWPEQPHPEADARPNSADGSKGSIAGGFKMPVHYPRFTEAQYAAMEEWRLDNLLNQYELLCAGGLEEKRKEAMAHFLWPEQPHPEADARTCGGVGSKGSIAGGIKMPVHYPRFSRTQYAAMEEWRLDNLLKQYGLPCSGNLEEKRNDAVGHFLWPEQPHPEADARTCGGDGSNGSVAGGFELALHYPLFSRTQYAAMEERRLPCAGGLEEKRNDAVGHFLWPEQLRPLAHARPYSADGKKGSTAGGFEMPVHYPRFTGAQYASMEEWRLDNLLNQYGLPCAGSLEEKRKDAMGHFLWMSQE